MLAKAYFFGEGVAKDHSKVKDLLIRSANMGNIEALSMLARAYQRGMKFNDANSSYGWIIEQNENASKAIKKQLVETVKAQYEYSAEAALLLASFYEYGYEGFIEINPIEAVNYYKKAYEISKKLSESGNEDATLLLARLYVSGKQVSLKIQIKHGSYFQN